VARRQGVPLFPVLTGGETFALGGDHVDKARPFHFAHGLEQVVQLAKVVAVDGAKIPES